MSRHKVVFQVSRNIWIVIILNPDFWILLRMWKILLQLQWLALGFLTL